LELLWTILSELLLWSSSIFRLATESSPRINNNHSNNNYYLLGGKMSWNHNTIIFYISISSNSLRYLFIARLIIILPFLLSLFCILLLILFFSLFYKGKNFWNLFYNSTLISLSSSEGKCSTELIEPNPKC